MTTHQSGFYSVHKHVSTRNNSLSRAWDILYQTPGGSTIPEQTTVPPNFLNVKRAKICYDQPKEIQSACKLRYMDDEEQLREKLAELELEHRDLDHTIDRLLESGQPVDFLQMQRLKKRKLMLKDHIEKIRSELLPDIIA